MTSDKSQLDKLLHKTYSLCFMQVTDKVASLVAVLPYFMGSKIFTALAIKVVVLFYCEFRALFTAVELSHFNKIIFLDSCQQL